MMTKEEIDAIVEAATDGVQIFYSAIEIDTHVKRPDGGYWDGYSALDAIISHAKKAAYLDAVAYCRETASEHNFDIYGKRELEMVANLLELRANGEEIT